MRRTLLIFAREPRPGDVKTRLAPIFTDAQRVEFYTAMLRDVLDAARGAQHDRCVVCWASKADPVRLREACHDEELTRQMGADLGERMLAALLEALDPENGDTAAVLIGSDAPLLTAGRIDEAFDRLGSADVVVGPSFDGGYYLIGARSGVREHLHRLFAGVRWSRPDVLEQTCERISDVRADADLSLAVLPMLDDVDTPQDLRRLRAHLRTLALADEPAPMHTTEFLFQSFPLAGRVARPVPPP